MRARRGRVRLSCPAEDERGELCEARLDVEIDGTVIEGAYGACPHVEFVNRSLDGDGDESVVDNLYTQLGEK